MLVATGEKCIGCKLCVKDCPSGAITITKVAEKEFEIAIDQARCIYCAQCVDSCQRKVLRSSQEFELASLNRATLRVMVSAEPPAPGEECDDPAPAQS
jgi:formate hydrogenlyase subunit 6/NADH:ubiquinone oxidoreductase subunit I